MGGVLMYRITALGVKKNCQRKSFLWSKNIIAEKLENGLQFAEI
jgi:hypothetical protein